jgi:cytochrome c-type biogenesis protein CcmH
MIPAIAIPAYQKLGFPGVADVPLQARLDSAAANKDYPAMIALLERHVDKSPDDLQSWVFLSDAYVKLDRFGDAAVAMSNLLRLRGRDALTLTDYGEMLTVANEGMVTPEAARVFSEALQLEPKYPKARFLAALSLKQEGKTAEAKAAFEALMADTPADAPWRVAVDDQLKSFAAVPGPNAEQVAAAQTMSQEDQQAMIRGMVDKLAEKLAGNPDDLEGWLRLVRAWAVLGETAKATAARTTAQTQFKDRPEALAQIDALSKDINLP